MLQAMVIIHKTLMIQSSIINILSNLHLNKLCRCNLYIYPLETNKLYM